MLAPNLLEASAEKNMKGTRGAWPNAGVTLQLHVDHGSDQGVVERDRLPRSFLARGLRPGQGDHAAAALLQLEHAAAEPEGFACPEAEVEGRQDGGRKGDFAFCQRPASQRSDDQRRAGRRSLRDLKSPPD